MNEANSNRETDDRKEVKRESWRKRLVPFLQDYQWLLWVVGIPAVLFFGYWGFKCSLAKGFPILGILYRVFQLFVLEMDSTITNPNWQLEIARWLALIIFGYTAVKALSVILRQQLQLAWIRFRFNDHIIVCGLGNKGLLIALKLKNDGHKIVAIEKEEENDNIKECRDNGIIVLIGNATSFVSLNKAGLDKAKYLFSVCGQDDINAEIAVQVRNLTATKRKNPLTCVVHIIDPQFCRVLKEQEFGLERVKGFRIEFLNLFDQAAQAIIDDQQLSPFEPKEIGASLSHHLLIVGVGYMGESLVIQAAKKWKELAHKTNEKLIITLIDRHANKKRDLLYLCYPGLDKACHIIPLEMDIKSTEFENGHFLFNNNGMCNLDIIYICLDNNSFALATALTLHNKLRKYNTPIVVRMSREAGLIKLLEDNTYSFKGIKGFGLLDRVLKPELLHVFTNERIARNIHDEYVKERLSEGETERINPFLVPWKSLPDRIKESNRRQADYIGYKLHSIGCYITSIHDWNAAPVEFTTDEIEKMAKLEHNLWMEERLNDDWGLAHGLKNLRKKKTPFLIHWSHLPEEEKEKDRDTVRKIPTYLSNAGFQIYRSENKPSRSKLIDI